MLIMVVMMSKKRRRKQTGSESTCSHFAAHFCLLLSFSLALGHLFCFCMEITRHTHTHTHTQNLCVLSLKGRLKGTISSHGSCSPSDPSNSKHCLTDVGVLGVGAARRPSEA